MEDSKLQKKHPGWMIPGREKLSFYIGGSSYMSVHTFISFFLAVYLLMIGVSTTVSALVLLFLKAWDAINDFIFGYLIDRVHFKP